MADDREITDWLAEMANDEEALPPALRDAILSSAPRPAPRVWWRPRLIWATPTAAALCGLWLGVAQPTLILDAVPGLDTVETTGQDPLDDWEGWL